MNIEFNDKENVEIEKYKALPDTFDEFNTLFKNPICIKLLNISFSYGML